MITGLVELIEFLRKLEERKIHFRLDKIRDSVLVEIAVPGQHWEVEFMADGSVEIEKYISTGCIHDRSELEVFFNDFSD